MMSGRFGELRIFSGNANRSLAESICGYLGIDIGRADVFKFSNDNTFVRILENVREQDVCIVQPTAYPVNDSVMELLIMIDAARRASAARVTAVVPHFGYGRTDKKDQPRVPITARLVADLIGTAGADRVLTVDLHAGQIQGFFNIPVDELTALPMFARYIEEKNLADVVVVAPDIGISKSARDLATRLGTPLAFVEKRRIGNKDHVESLNVIGDVNNKMAVTIDDEIDTGGTLVEAISAVTSAGARGVYACATHGLLSGDAVTKLQATAQLKELVLTDTIDIPEQKRASPKVTVLSIAPLLGEAISRIQSGRSIGALFN